MKIKHGSTRVVICAFNLAFKLPTMTEYRLFLQGLLANMQEVRFSGHQSYGWGELCPVIFNLPLGLLVVMPEARVMTAEEFDGMSSIIKEEYCSSLVEFKVDSFGYLPCGKLVAIDYG